MNGAHDAYLEDVALYALGMLPAAGAARVRDHLTSCEECRREYAALASTPLALARGGDAGAPSDVLKARLMREVRASIPAAHRSTARARGIVNSPAYAMAAACLVIAIISLIANVFLSGKYRASQAGTAALTAANAKLNRQLHDERSEVADLLGPDTRRFAVAQGVVVRSHNRVYLALHDLHQPRAGHTYQAWTLPKGEKAMVPSITFKPDANGDAMVPLPVDADVVAAVAVSVEPDGGSKAPTTKPILVTNVD